MKSKTVIHILAVIATIASAANLLVALSLLLGACTDDNGLGNDGTDGTDPATTALLTPRDISTAATTVSATTRAVYEELGVGTSQQPNAIITAFSPNDKLTLDYSFSPADANANPDGSPDADSYTYHATLTRQAATPLWQISTKDAGNNNPLRPDADTHHGESWAYARARLTYEPLKTPGGGATAELIPGTDATPTGYFYMGGTDPITNIATRMYYDRLVATTAITSGSGSLRIVTDLNDPNLGQFSATLQHAGAMLRLKPDDIFIDPDFVEGYTADGLSLMATVRPAGGSEDGTDNYILAFSRVTAVSGSTPGAIPATPAVGTLQALLPAGATVLAFQAVLTKKNGNDDVVSTTTFPLSTTPITVAANHRYPMTLALTATKAEVSFAKAEGELGFGEEEEKVESDALEGFDYELVKDGNDNVTGWTVHTAAGLKGFAALVNSATSNDAVLKLNCTLTADIDLSLLPKDDTGSNWTPIGNFSKPYQGTFDGSGHTVSGLVINRPSTSYQGFFGRIGRSDSPATVKNLTVEGTVTGGKTTGGIVGCSYSSTITNCTNKGSVKGTSETGGVAGYNNNSSTITNCTNKGSVTGTDNRTGGVAGYNSNSSTITACTNTGSVTGTGNYTGGVVGENDSSSTITACYSTGSVTGKNIHIGGVAGRNYSSTITACYSTGSVTGTDIYGGVVGTNSSSTITTCYWQTFGPTDSRPTQGIGKDDGGTITDVNPISSAYTTDGTPSWFAPATPSGTDTPVAKLNEAIETWNDAHTDDDLACPYRFVENTAYSEALSKAGAPDYDTPVPPLLLEIPTEPTPP